MLINFLKNIAIAVMLTLVCSPWLVDDMLKGGF